MRSSWIIQVGSKYSDKYLYKKDRRGGRVTMEAETGERWPFAKECPEPPDPGNGGRRKPGSADNLTSDFWLQDWGGSVPCCFKAPSSGPLYGSPGQENGSLGQENGSPGQKNGSPGARKPPKSLEAAWTDHQSSVPGYQVLIC